MSNAVNHPVASVRIQPQAFDVGAELRALRQTEDGAWDTRVGAVATFVGTVRDLNEGESVKTLTLEHYPGMTESSIKEIIDQANQRCCGERVLLLVEVLLNLAAQVVRLSGDGLRLGLNGKAVLRLSSGSCGTESLSALPSRPADGLGLWASHYDESRFV